MEQARRRQGRWWAPTRPPRRRGNRDSREESWRGGAGLAHENRGEFSEGFYPAHHSPTKLSAGERDFAEVLEKMIM